MYRTPGLVSLAGLLVGLIGGLSVATRAVAQTPLDQGFATGDAARAWALWQPAAEAILADRNDEAEALFGQLLALDPSPFRLALLAERTMSRTAAGGALLLLREDYESDALSENARRVVELLEAGREQMNEADDGWYFCAVGRFDVADANFRALLAGDPDPVALLEFTDAVPQRREVLIRLTDNEVVGESVRALLRLLDLGEERIKADPTRIKTRIELLGGPPRAFENSVALLKQSGEYAVPFLLQYMRDPEQGHLRQAILRCLPQIDRPGLNPLVYALRVEHPLLRQYLVETLGQIGYAQAVPYLLQLRADEGLMPEVASAIDLALARLEQRGANVAQSAAEAFYELAQGYYEGQASLAADPRLDYANVWYWRDDMLQNIPVPTRIFDEIMCMRSCEEALLLDPQLTRAQALWVAANFRRAAQLGEVDEDPTRPADDPSPAYFAQTAGPEVCLMVLARALDRSEPAVALGAIAALRNTAGPASIVADEGGRLPLAEALSFPDRMVRIRAALALAAARPEAPFVNYQNLMPVLSEALLLHAGGRNALVVDPDAETANEMAAILRAGGFEVLSDATLLGGLRKVREQMPALDVIFLASDVRDVPVTAALAQVRAESRFGATPVVLVGKPGGRDIARDLVRADHRLGQVEPGTAAEEVLAVVERVGSAVGVTAVTPEMGRAVALETAQVLRLLALSRNSLFPVAEAQRALIQTLASTDPELRLAVAGVLAFVAEPAAQEALARIALDAEADQQMRVSMFAVLAESAKHCGNLLGAELIGQIIALAESEPNLVIRTAASQALGALDVPADMGSEIIRNQYRG
jgi:tetratricopeptide (TPR) repeat protein